MNLLEHIRTFFAHLVRMVKTKKIIIITLGCLICIYFCVSKDVGDLFKVFNPTSSLNSSDIFQKIPATLNEDSLNNTEENSEIEDEKTFTTFRISPDGCKELFDKSPEEFVSVADTFFPWTDNFAEAAILDEDGFLLLTLSEKSQNEWKEAFQPYLDKAEACNRITISEDYTQITVAGFKETITVDLMTSRMACHACIINLFLKHKNFENIKIEYTIIDGKTSEIKKTVNWPEQGFSMQLSTADFSSIY